MGGLFTSQQPWGRRVLLIPITLSPLTAFICVYAFEVVVFVCPLQISKNINRTKRCRWHMQRRTAAIVHSWEHVTYPLPNPSPDSYRMLTWVLLNIRIPGVTSYHFNTVLSALFNLWTLTPQWPFLSLFWMWTAVRHMIPPRFSNESQRSWARP